MKFTVLSPDDYSYESRLVEKTFKSRLPEFITALRYFPSTKFTHSYNKYDYPCLELHLEGESYVFESNQWDNRGKPYCETCYGMWYSLCMHQTIYLLEVERVKGHHLSLFKRKEHEGIELLDIDFLDSFIKAPEAFLHPLLNQPFSSENNQQIRTVLFTFFAEFNARKELEEKYPNKPKYNLRVAKSLLKLAKEATKKNNPENAVFLCLELISYYENYLHDSYDIHKTFEKAIAQAYQLVLELCNEGISLEIDEFIFDYLYAMYVDVHKHQIPMPVIFEIWDVILNTSEQKQKLIDLYLNHCYGYRFNQNAVSYLIQYMQEEEMHVELMEFIVGLDFPHAIQHTFISYLVEQQEFEKAYAFVKANIKDYNYTKHGFKLWPEWIALILRIVIGLEKENEIDYYARLTLLSDPERYLYYDEIKANMDENDFQLILDELFEKCEGNPSYYARNLYACLLIKTGELNYFFELAVEYINLERFIKIYFDYYDNLQDTLYFETLTKIAHKAVKNGFTKSAINNVTKSLNAFKRKEPIFASDIDHLKIELKERFPDSFKK